MKTKQLCAGLMLVCGYASQSLAYTFIDYCGSTPVRWPGSSKAYSASGTSFPSGSAALSALQTAINRINEPINFTVGVATGDTRVAIGNGESEIWYSSSAQHSPAVTYNYTSCAGSPVITESDIVFYSREPYTYDMTLTGLYGYGGGNRPFQTTAVHELGHGINLMHVASEYNIMGQDYYHLHANAGVGRSYLGEDAADGAIYLYGSNSRQDVSLVHWKWIGSSGQYSTHGRTRLYNSSGSELPWATVSGDPTWSVSAGQTIQVELTAENNGASSQNVQIGFYLSTNNAIATSDTLIATQTLTVSRANVDTYLATITLPTGLAAGDYWLGAIIDNNNVVSEYAEDNNATYWRVRYTEGGTTPPAVGVLTNGVPKTNLSAETGQNLNFYMDVPAGAKNLQFRTSGGSGDSDMYVRFGAQPTLTTYDCRPYRKGNNESCSFSAPQAGRYYIMLNAYSSFSGVTLTGSHQ